MTTSPATGVEASPSTRPAHLVRLACDSDNLDALIATPFVRTYADLIATPADLDRLRQRFPDSIIELMDRGLGDPGTLATIADIERGALTLAQLPEWFGTKHAAGTRDLVSYCSLDNFDAVDQALTGIPHWNWIAWYGHLFVPDRPDMQVQFANAAMVSAHLDLTIIPNYRYRPARIPVGAAADALFAALGPAVMLGPGSAFEPGDGPVILPTPGAPALTDAPASAPADASAVGTGLTGGAALGLTGGAALLAAAAPAPMPGYTAPAPLSWPLAAYFHALKLASHHDAMTADLAALRTIIRSGLPAELVTGLADLL